MSAGAAHVLVVGAGTTGLALALQAHAHGAQVRVIERREAPARPSRALIVHPRTLEVLRPLGVTGALLERGDPAPHVLVHLGARVIPVALGPLALADTAYPHLLFATQATVESVLGDALAARGVEVERGCELVGADLGHDEFRARLRRHGRCEQVAGRFLVGCDGPASTVRRIAGVGWRGRAYRQEVVLADLELVTDLSPGTGHAVAAPGGVLFLFSPGEGATWRLLSTRAARGAGGAPGQPGDAVPAGVLQGLLDGAALPARVAAVAWSARVPLEHRVATAYRAGPVLLAGDAAHVHSPAGGQGMNTGIQDATNLGWKLALAGSSARPSATETLLASYDAERRPAARRVVALTHLLFWGEAGTGPVAGLLRRRLAPAAAPALAGLVRQPRLLAAAARVLAPLDLVYRGSPLSLEGGTDGRRRARPGARLPDETVSVAGRSCRLHDLLAAPGIHVLLDDEATVSGVGAGGDGARLEAALRSGAGGGVHLHRIDSWRGAGGLGVRPDGHVGYRSGSADAGELLRWLELLAIA